jgi:hypothetical protein
MNVTRAWTRDELRDAVRRQLRFIASSTDRVLQGDNDEALRIAVSLRVLLHDTPSSHSLLGDHLGWKHRLRYVNSLRPLEIAPGISISLTGTVEGEVEVQSLAVGGYGLVELVNSPDGMLRYRAPLNEPDREAADSGLVGIDETLDFTEWWEKPCLYSEGVPAFSRRELMSVMAHKAGGAHVDRARPSRKYEDFRLQGAGVGYIDLPDVSGGLPEQIDISKLIYPGDAAAPTMVQVGWEIRETLRRAGLPDGEV